MSKPVELITINAMHTLLDKIDGLHVPDALKKTLLSATFEQHGLEIVARTILQSLATEASMTVVLRALAAVGAPADLPQIRERMIATRDSRRAEA